ncbi:sugar ABC transporter permease [Erysipelothrix larvae]|uniref:Maltose/maltodextrin transport system permease protein n=1 Tax=Erysipelothrix larvae TaxID=1514105 RepID=A0A0X8GYE3_9FIRM|nr:sugar ABC transporter permease [Erysipelothrix larvae]AMC92719.1 sugar ABC transporter permease [Erysipelothrix larvae]
MEKLKQFFEPFKFAIKDGDSKTKLSLVVMGAGSFLRKQYVRGFTYLLIQIGFIAYMITSGLSQIAGLRTLGTVEQGQVFDEARGIYVYTQGDNSMLFLLFGVMAVLLFIAFVGVYRLSVKNAVENQQLCESKQPLISFKQDCHDLMDGKFHITVLSLPTVLVTIFTILPLIFMIFIAFTNYDINHQPPGNLFTWVGLNNFRDLVASNGIISGTFYSLLLWTLIWAFFATFLNYVLGMLVAMLINHKQIKLKKLWRTLLVVTIAVPQFVSLMLMSQLLSDNGALNGLLASWGWISEFQPIKFLTDPNIARITVIVVNVWVGIPYTMLITSGILMNVPQDMYESARIDGASAWVQFRKITLPYMLNVTTPYLITQFVGNINNFNVIFLLTGGGPLTLSYYKAGRTDLLVTWLYKLALTEKNYALASAIGIIIFMIMATLSLVVFRRTLEDGRESTFQ